MRIALLGLEVLVRKNNFEYEEKKVFFNVSIF